MITTWQIILAIITVGLSIIMPIYYSHENKKILKQKTEDSEGSRIKEYINKINKENRNKNR